MKKAELSKHDYNRIQDHALSIWQSRSSAGVDNFNIRCILEAFVDYTRTRGIIVKEGQIYEKDKEPTETV